MDKFIDAVTEAIIAVVLIPVVFALTEAANVTGLTQVVILLVPTFLAIYVLISTLKKLKHTG